MRIRKTLITVTILTVIVVVAATANAATINVPSDYPTIQAAINAAAAGDTINVAAGTYHEQLTILKALTINGADGAVLDGTGLLPTWTTGVQIKSGNVTFNNIDVINFTQDGITAYKKADMPNIHITNCKVANIQPGNWGFGIYVGYESEAFKYTGTSQMLSHLDFSGLLIEGNEVVNTNSSAVVVQAVTGTPGTLVVRNNYIHDGENDGIWIDCARNVVIEDNVVENNMDGIYISSYGDAFMDPIEWTYDWSNQQLNGPYGPKNIQISGNQILDSVTYGGIYLQAGWPATISINGNSITGNNPIGVANYLSEPVGATCNWWGDASGPGPVGPGSGDGVSLQVNYEPWQISPGGPCVGPDSDNDGYTDGVDNCPTNFNPDQNPAACETKKSCNKYYDDQKKDFDKGQHDANKAFDDQQKADKKAYFDSDPKPTPEQKKAFEDAQKAAKKAFDDQQKADKKAFDEANKANKEQCKTLPKD